MLFDTLQQNATGTVELKTVEREQRLSLTPRQCRQLDREVIVRACGDGVRAIAGEQALEPSRLASVCAHEIIEAASLRQRFRSTAHERRVPPANHESTATVQELTILEVAFVDQTKPDQSARAGLKAPIFEVCAAGRQLDEAAPHPLESAGLRPFGVGLKSIPAGPMHQLAVPAAVADARFDARETQQICEGQLAQIPRTQRASARVGPRGAAQVGRQGM
jgi:hypothetical protein